MILPRWKPDSFLLINKEQKTYLWYTDDIQGYFWQQQKKEIFLKYSTIEHVNIPIVHTQERSRISDPGCLVQLIFKAVFGIMRFYKRCFYISVYLTLYEEIFI